MPKCKRINSLGVAIYTNGNFRPCYVYRYQWHSDEQSAHSYMHMLSTVLNSFTARVCGVQTIKDR